MFFARRPSPEQIKQFIARSQDQSFSYAPIGIARESPRGFKVDESLAVVGHGLTTFKRAREALQTWRHFDLGWVVLFPEYAAVETGTVVVVLVRHLGFWSLNGCRIVYLLDTNDESFGFAYGTLRNHAELGEEIFEVRFDPASQEVTYRIRAVSKPRALMALAGYPITRWFQQRFRRDSLAAMKRAVSE